MSVTQMAHPQVPPPIASRAELALVAHVEQEVALQLAKMSTLQLGVGQCGLVATASLMIDHQWSAIPLTEARSWLLKGAEVQIDLVKVTHHQNAVQELEIVSSLVFLGTRGDPLETLTRFQQTLTAAMDAAWRTLG